MVISMRLSRNAQVPTTLISCMLLTPENSMSFVPAEAAANLGLSERFLAGHQKDDIVGHHAPAHPPWWLTSNGRSAPEFPSHPRSLLNAATGLEGLQIIRSTHQ